MKFVIALGCLMGSALSLLASQVSQRAAAASGEIEFHGAFARWTANELALGAG